MWKNSAAILCGALFFAADASAQSIPELRRRVSSLEQAVRELDSRTTSNTRRLRRHEAILKDLAAADAALTRAVEANAATTVELGRVVEAQGTTLGEARREIQTLQQRVASLEQRVVEVAVPTGAIAYFGNSECPVGWSRALELNGRYAVAVADNTKNYVGTTVGAPLEGPEDRPAGAHTHRFDDTVSRAGYDGPMDRFLLESYSRMGLQYISIGDRTDNGDGLRSGTNAPYVMLSACRKN